MNTCTNCAHCLLWHNLLICKKSLAQTGVHINGIASLLDFIDDAVTTKAYHCSSWKQAPESLHAKYRKRHWYIHDRHKKRIIVLDHKPALDEYGVDNKAVAGYCTYFGHGLYDAAGNKLSTYASRRYLTIQGADGKKWNINRNMKYECEKFGKKAIAYFKELDQ